ncbi:glycine/betaine ABC transporter substrate-binding protein, partial [Thermopolyspora sp. NPDC052614]
MRRIRLLAGALLLSLAATGCGGATVSGGSTSGASTAPSAGGSGGASSGGTVKIAINPWVGYEANAA